MNTNIVVPGEENLRGGEMTVESYVDKEKFRSISKKTKIPKVD